MFVSWVITRAHYFSSKLGDGDLRQDSNQLRHSWASVIQELDDIFLHHLVSMPDAHVPISRMMLCIDIQGVSMHIHTPSVVIASSSKVSSTPFFVWLRFWFFNSPLLSFSMNSFSLFRPRISEGGGKVHISSSLARRSRSGPCSTKS